MAVGLVLLGRPLEIFAGANVHSSVEVQGETSRPKLHSKASAARRANGETCS